jgi:hypothetical protein
MFWTLKSKTHVLPLIGIWTSICTKAPIHYFIYSMVYCYSIANCHRLDVSPMPRMPPHSAKVLKPCLIFSNFKGDNCQKSLDCNFNLIKVREWKLKISYFFVISRGITLSKSKDHNQIRTWPAHSYDVSTRAISTLYMHLNKS